jgi:hypothetical protein
MVFQGERGSFLTKKGEVSEGEGAYFTLPTHKQKILSKIKYAKLSLNPTAGKTFFILTIDSFFDTISKFVFSSF